MQITVNGEILDVVSVGELVDVLIDLDPDLPVIVSYDSVSGRNPNLNGTTGFVYRSSSRFEALWL